MSDPDCDPTMVAATGLSWEASQTKFRVNTRSGESNRVTDTDAPQDINVLVVDDDYFIRTTLQLQLKVLGCQPIIAPNAEVALQSLPQSNITVAIVDLHLPTMDGLQLVSAIHDYDSTIQCIVLTGAASTETAVEALRVQVYDYVLKPISQADLMRIVQRAADHTQLLREKQIADAALTRRSEELAASLDALRRVQDHLIRAANAALMGQLADGLQHELGNALTVIQLNVNLLKIFREDPEKFQRHMESLEQGVHSIERITLALGYFPTKGDDLLEILDLGEIVREAVNDVAKVYPKSKEIISVDIPGAAALCGDEFQLVRAFAGIIENAVEASWQLHPDSPKVSVVLHTEEERWYIRITDNGSGFTPEALLHAVEPGFTTKIERGFMRGLGMGLFVTSTVVDKHSGELKFSNLPEGGALVELWLPRSTS